MEQKIFPDGEGIKLVVESMQLRPMVFTNGCFDILHRGHVAYLAEARSFGDCLVVGVNTDESVQMLGKEPDRPFNSTADRMAIIAALQAVDFVVSFSDPTPLQLIKTLQPDILVKGGDWAVDQIVGADFVQQRNGRVVSIPVRHKRSTTALVNRIKKR